MEWKRKKYDINFGYLVYEGEFLNGRSNGKGKLYKNGKLIYEGEFKNNSRNGKGKEYDKNGKKYLMVNMKMIGQFIRKSNKIK